MINAQRRLENDLWKLERQEIIHTLEFIGRALAKMPRRQLENRVDYYAISRRHLCEAMTSLELQDKELERLLS